MFLFFMFLFFSFLIFRVWEGRIPNTKLVSSLGEVLEVTTPQTSDWIGEGGEEVTAPPQTQPAPTPSSLQTSRRQHVLYGKTRATVSQSAMRCQSPSVCATTSMCW